jgi:hypothetical protein
MRVQHAVTQATALLILARTGDAALQRKRNPGTLMRRGRVEEKDCRETKRPAQRRPFLASLCVDLTSYWRPGFRSGRTAKCPGLSG